MNSIIPSKTPGFITKMFPQFVWNIDTKEKSIYLTFDDGPNAEVTPWVLETLTNYNALATFFCIGKNIKEEPKLFDEIIRSGHSIGNHTYSHLKGWKTKTNTYIQDTKESEAIIEKHLNNFSEDNYQNRLQPMFRPPYGKFKIKQAKQLLSDGYKLVLWDVLSFDWDIDTSPQECYKNVIENTKEGSIIVFHDSLKAQKNLKYALPKTLEYYSEKGFSFKPLSFKRILE